MQVHVCFLQKKNGFYIFGEFSLTFCGIKGNTMGFHFATICHMGNCSLSFLLFCICTSRRLLVLIA